MSSLDNTEAWENRELGADEQFVTVADESVETALDEACGTKLISIRMSKEMIDWLKLIGERNGGLRYQTLIKTVLARFIESEQKIILNEMLAEKQKALAAEDAPEPQRKVAG